MVALVGDAEGMDCWIASTCLEAAADPSAALRSAQEDTFLGYAAWIGTLRLVGFVVSHPFHGEAVEGGAPSIRITYKGPAASRGRRTLLLSQSNPGGGRG